MQWQNSFLALPTLFDRPVLMYNCCTCSAHKVNGNGKILVLKKQIVFFLVKSRFLGQSHSQRVHSKQVRHLFGLFDVLWQLVIWVFSLLFLRIFSRSFEGQGRTRHKRCCGLIYKNIWKQVDMYFALRIQT